MTSRNALTGKLGSFGSSAGRCALRFAARSFAAWVLVLLAEPVARAEGQSNAIYDATCALCHQQKAAGLPGQFPRLAGRVDRMAADPQARDYLLHTVMFGMSGKIEVDGAPITGVMPAFATLSDADLASVLDYLIRLGGSVAKKVRPVSSQEIGAVRSGPHLSTAEVAARRAALVAGGRMP